MSVEETVTMIMATFVDGILKTPRRKLILSDSKEQTTPVHYRNCKLCVCNQLSRAASKSMNLYLLKTSPPTFMRIVEELAKTEILNE